MMIVALSIKKLINLSSGGVGAVSAVLGQGAAVLAGVPRGGRAPVPGEARGARREEAGLGAPHHVRGEVAEDPVHHGEVLQVVVGLEQGVALQQHTF